MWLHFLSHIAEVFLALFPVVNPVGCIAIFYGLTGKDNRPYQMLQARRTAIDVAAILAVALLVGEPLLHFFGISLGALRIAGGLVVARTAWQMLGGTAPLGSTEPVETQSRHDISFVPMALPLLAGPGAIGVVVGLAAEFTRPADFAGALIGLLLLSALIYLLFVMGEPLVRLLGPTGIDAFSRVLGFFILAIAVELVAAGIGAFRV